MAGLGMYDAVEVGGASRGNAGELFVGEVEIENSPGQTG